MTTWTVPPDIYVIIDGPPGPIMTIWTVPPCNGRSARGSPVVLWMVSSVCFLEYHCSHMGGPNVYCHVRSPPDQLFCDGPPIIIASEVRLLQSHLQLCRRTYVRAYVRSSPRSTVLRRTAYYYCKRSDAITKSLATLSSYVCTYVCAF